MSRILIAVPTYENIYPDTFKSIYQLDKGDNEVEFDFFRGYDVANARNQIGQATIDRKFDYVLMLDNDETIPKDGLVNLLETMRAERTPTMVVGYTLSRPQNAGNTDDRTTVFKWGGKDYVRNDAYTVEELKALKDNGRTKVQIRGSGLGCALIDRRVFEKLPFPWFKWLVYNNKSQLSEDLYFCEQFPQLRAPIYVDTRVACGHMMRYIANV